MGDMLITSARDSSGLVPFIHWQAKYVPGKETRTPRVGVNGNDKETFTVCTEGLSFTRGMRLECEVCINCGEGADFRRAGDVLGSSPLKLLELTPQRCPRRYTHIW